jgi:protein-tyrosine phosphatase
MALTSPPVDASRVAPNLWVGARPPPGHYRWLGVIVLAAKEWQPPSFAYPNVAVLHAPLDDDPARPMPEDQISTAIATARTVARYLQSKRRVMTTCHLGRNRSSLIAGLAMRIAYDTKPDEVISQIRAARGPFALRNPHFTRLLRTFAG